MKISKSKQELASIISVNGGWRDKEEWATQDSVVAFFSGGKPKYETYDKTWCANGDDGVFIVAIGVNVKIKGFHNTILSRDEYFHLYPAPDADGWIEWKGGEPPVDAGTLVDVRFKDGMEMAGAPVGVTPDHFPRHLTSWRCSTAPSAIVAYRLHKPEQAKPEPDQAVESKPTIVQLAADYRNRKDYADRKQEEADAAKADADSKLAELVAAGKAVGLVLSVTPPEPELVITDWRDLLVGDEVEAKCHEGVSIGFITEMEPNDYDGERPFRFQPAGYSPRWCTSPVFRFIRRP